MAAEMKTELAYCSDLDERIDRLKRLYEGKAEDQVMAVMDVPRRTLAEFGKKYEGGACACPPVDERLRFWDSLLQEGAVLHDDRIPAAYLTELDQGLYGGLLGAELRYMADPGSGWISSMVAPLLSGWDDFEELQWDAAGAVATGYGEMLEAYVRAAAGPYGISHFILINGFNFLYELFGATRAYLEAEENPERVRDALELGYRLNVWVQNRFFGAVPLVAGGTCSTMVSWAPGRVISESVDPFHMASVDYFLKWGKDPLERVLAQYDGGVVHIHMNGLHLLEAVSAVIGLRAIMLSDERGCLPAFSAVSELKRRAGGMPLVVSASFDEFSTALKEHRLTGGVLYKVSDVPDNDTANRMMDMVREYRT